ncbi:hypothetical protein BDW75DRAFT_199647 [Aspergillus navahoensis]
MNSAATMATVASVSLLSEAEFGCEHLASQLMHEGPASSQFKTSFIKTHNALGRRDVFHSHPSSVLKPKYTCLTCSEPCMNGDRKAHTERTGHQFYMESRSRALFCQGCEDLVYDHGLERCRSATPESTLQVAKKRRFSESSADELYVKSNANRRPCAKQGVRGLFNLGQTCYLNVILQTLLHDPILSTYFLGNGHQPHDCAVADCIGCAVAEAFADFNSIDKPEGFAALNLLLASWRASPTLAGYQQQDAHEYYQFLVDKLHTSAEGSRETHEKSCSCFFHRTFYGKLRSSVTCDRCGNVTKTEDPIVDLSLDVQVQAKKRAMGGGTGPSATPTLSGCLESFTSPEKLMADVYNCSGCGNTPQKATKQLRIKKLPAILCMQLKRFEHTFSVSEKVEGRIDFPLSINMLPYTTNPNTCVDKSRYTYDLSSAVVHKGKLDAGHYYVYCRQGDEWMLFNDDQVTPVTEAEVLSVDAYLLFYNLRCLAKATS